MGEVVDANDGNKEGGSADEQIDRSEPDDRLAQAFELGPGDRQLFIAEQDDEDAGDAEDGSRGSGSDRVVAKDDVDGQAEQVARDAGDEIDGDQTKGPQQRLAKQAKIPEAPHVGGDVEQANVDEGGGDEAIPLAVKDQRGLGGAEVDQVAGGGLAGGDTGEHHPEIDRAVNSEQE